MADAQHTEKPTKRRVDKARKEGNFPASREFISAVQFLGFVTIAVSFSGVFLMRTARVMRYLFERAFTVEITQTEVVALVRQVIVPELTPLVFAGAALVALVVFAQLATTRLGISLSKLMPDIKRLNVLKKFSSVPAQECAPVFPGPAAVAAGRDGGVLRSDRKSRFVSGAALDGRAGGCDRA